MALYGQQINVGDSTATPRSVYMVTEAYDATAPPDDKTKGDIRTVTLNDLYHLSRLADLVWRNNVTTSQTGPSYNDSTVTTDISSRVSVQSRVSYNLRNQSTDLVTVRVYVCRARQDTNMLNYVSTGENQTSLLNIYQQLSRGFSANGIDPTTPNPEANAGMLYRHYNAFQSLVFTENWKIVKTRLYTLRPGAMKKLYLKSRPFTFRPSKYFSLIGQQGDSTWRTSKLCYLHNRHEKFVLFQINSQPMGYGAAQANYSKLVSNTSPTVILNTEFRYHVNLLAFEKTPHANIEQLGFAAPSSTVFTIVNPLESVLAEEKDAY